MFANNTHLQIALDKQVKQQKTQRGGPDGCLKETIEQDTKKTHMCIKSVAEACTKQFDSTYYQTKRLMTIVYRKAA